MRPLGRHVLLQMRARKEIEEEVFKDVVSDGGIILTTATKRTDKDVENHVVREDIGTISMIGPMAFSDYDEWDIPKIGEKVLITGYAGDMIEFTDGRLFRVVVDKDIKTIFSEDDGELV